MTDPDEQALLAAWSQEMQRVEPRLKRETKAIRMPGSLQFALCIFGDEEMANRFNIIFGR